MRDQTPASAKPAINGTWGELEVLLHVKDDLNRRIASGAQEPSPGTDELHEMSICLALIECEIVRERMRLGSQDPGPPLLTETGRSDDRGSTVRVLFRYWNEHLRPHVDVA